MVGNKNIKELVGVVVSTKMSKTLVVSVEVISMNKLIQKRHLKHKRFYAHVESDDVSVWDKVLIRSDRPRSKLKRWIYIETLQKTQLS